MVYKYYKIDGDKITLLKRKCPRCNSFMADHYDRFACGKCGYTAFKTQEEKTKGKPKGKTKGTTKGKTKTKTTKEE